MSPPTCAHCNTAAVDLKRCSHCKFTLYCNRACQKSHWKQHKHICSRFEAVAVEYSVDPSVPRAFPNYLEYMEECDRTGERMVLPSGCYTTHCEPDGLLVAVVDEEKYQEHQLREAEKRSADAAESDVESLKDDVGGEVEGGF